MSDISVNSSVSVEHQQRCKADRKSNANSNAKTNSKAKASSDSSNPSTSEATQLCNTCLTEKPIKSFVDVGIKKDGTKYKSKKCRTCINSKVNPEGDDDSIRKIKLQAIDKALSVSAKAMELISTI